MDFQDYLVPGKTGLLIGIGGVSMSPLAEVLHDAGLDIRGSDMSESDNTLTLRERGIPIHIGHSAAAMGIWIGRELELSAAPCHSC